MKESVKIAIVRHPVKSESGIKGMEEQDFVYEPKYLARC
jgi:hypothetical protein